MTASFRERTFILYPLRSGEGEREPVRAGGLPPQTLVGLEHADGEAFKGFKGSKGFKEFKEFAPMREQILRRCSAGTCAGDRPTRGMGPRMMTSG